MWGRVVGFAGVVRFLLVSSFLGVVSSGRAVLPVSPGMFCWVGSACPLPWLLVQGCSVCILLLGVVGFLGGMVYRPSLFFLGGAVNLLGVISFSVSGWGYSIFLVILFLFG